ncbi:hypothetical protein [Lonsdalea quercina]|uniref:hypothetical protein n=1 Tax=Lonsdalea quercina TaxID=71657 RepID=UPI00397624E3
MLTTPKKINSFVKRFGDNLCNANESDFCFYKFKRIDEFQPLAGECFYNVARMIKENGGGYVLGWMIWEDETHIEAEAHCLYKNENGKVMDITPRVDEEREILFLKDSNVHPKLSYVDGDTYKMTHKRWPMFYKMEGFSPYSEITFNFNKSEIEVIDLKNYHDSFLLK